MVSAAAAVATPVLVLLSVSAWGSLEGWTEVVPLLLLMVSPYLALAALALWLCRSWVQLAVAVVATVMISAWGLYCLLDAFVVSPGPLCGLIAMAVAGAQWVGVLIATGLGGGDALVRWVASRRRR
jgi:hypothetical protein